LDLPTRIVPPDATRDETEGVVGQRGDDPGRALRGLHLAGQRIGVLRHRVLRHQGLGLGVVLPVSQGRAAVRHGLDLGIGRHEELDETEAETRGGLPSEVNALRQGEDPGGRVRGRIQGEVHPLGLKGQERAEQVRVVPLVFTDELFLPLSHAKNTDPSAVPHARRRMDRGKLPGFVSRHHASAPLQDCTRDRCCLEIEPILQ